MAPRSLHYPRFGSRGHFVLASLCSFAATSAGASTCRADAFGGGDGSAWDATRTLQDALSNLTCDEVWVKAGTYTPTTEGSRGAKFLIKRQVRVYGGFAGTEETRSARDPAANLTTLSGEIGAAGNADNSYTVMHIDGSYTSPGITASTVLDGFTISGAQGDDNGGGLICDGYANSCCPTISNVIFSGNYGVNGAALVNDGRYGGTSSPTLTNVTFDDNHATNGAALSNDGTNGNSSPILTNVTFNGNSSLANGGAIFNQGLDGNSSPILTNVTFYNNSAGSGGGAMFGNPGPTGNSSPVLTNVTFHGNSATYGGALYVVSTITLNNVIAWGDSAEFGPEIYRALAGTSVLASHSDIQGSGGSGAGWQASVGVDLGGNIDADPLLGGLANNGGATLTLLPGAGSPAMNTADDATCASTDQRGQGRPQGPHCDIGAVEVIYNEIFADGFDVP